MTVTMKLEGFEGFERNLAQLEKLATRRAVARRALMKAAKPMAEMAQGMAPRDTGRLANSIIVGAKLNGRQAKLHRRMFKDDRTSIELFVGPSYLLGGGGRHGHLVEFGTVHHSPQPFMRPAWDQDHKNLLQRLGELMAKEIEKAITRQARRAGG